MFSYVISTGLNSISQKIHVHLELQMTLFGNKISADAISLYKVMLD